MKDKKKWKIILSNLGFEKKKHKVLLKYIQTHIEYKTNYNNFIQQKTNKHFFRIKDDESLILALKFISELNFDKLRFIDVPALIYKDKLYKTSSFGIVYEITPNTPIIKNEDKIKDKLLEKSIDSFNERIKDDKYLYIYVLFANYTINDNRILLLHKCFISNDNIKI